MLFGFIFFRRKWGRRARLFLLNLFHQFWVNSALALWQLNMRGWQYKQRWIDAFSPRGKRKKRQRGVERKMEEWKGSEGGGKTERWRWRRDGECDSVMHAGFIVSPQRPREIISSQYGVYQSSQNTILPSGYMSCLSASLLLSVFTCCL